MNCLIACLLLFLRTGAHGAPRSGQPLLANEDIPGGSITRSERFNGNSLWGYIDGGADLYLEFGFQSVDVQEITWRDLHFKIDVYTMQTAEAAYGIFSLSRRRCLEADSLPPAACVSPHQVQVTRGPLYMTIVNDGGTPREQELCLHLARLLLAKTTGETFVPPRYFSRPSFLPYVHSLKYIQGPLGLQNGFPEWEDLFGGLSGYSLYILQADTPEGSLRAAQIRFADTSGKQAFCKKFGVDAKTGDSSVRQDMPRVVRAVRELSPLEIRLIESSLPEEKLAPFLADFAVPD